MNLLSASLILLLALTYIAWSREEYITLNRAFNSYQKNALWIRCKGRCEMCGVKLVPYAGRDNSAEADHIIPYSKFGRTALSNGQMICRSCNRSKGSK